MIEEAAGTRMYESKKLSAQKTIEKKESKLKEIETVINLNTRHPYDPDKKFLYTTIEVVAPLLESCESTLVPISVLQSSGYGADHTITNALIF